ncbi:MAG: NUDIX domain-containing protein [Flavobacterium sp.]
MWISKIYLTVDTLVFRKTENQYELLLIKRKNEPFKDCWAIPGGFVDENEDLETAAKRELLEETQIAIEKAEQLKAFGKPFRDPRFHTVTVAFYGFVPENTIAKAADDAKEAKWFLINNLPELAFDHLEIINFALEKLNIENR